ncbi:hemerythrin domain-containing protein [Phycicoccus flavus]|uniref:hemerythrin domain-containing protein n=1 Tax=Phycicoccus flavus TaxID=2502783 RepID=UPI000FEB7F7D|nr:hemerythrin domain-containing protein [Phycicoccus flavus]NHA68323.1 cation-binding protein [Phycicoccus flavus]
MDITEVIQHQHDEQRRGFAHLEEWPREDHEGLAAMWRRLSVLLETHAEAEERYFYPRLLDLGTGAADADDTAEEVEDAVHDHNALRAAIARVAEAEVGSQDWWTAVVDANTENSDHMGEEERQDLADFRQQATVELRHEIAVEFLRFQARHSADGVEPRDKDPQDYAAHAGTGSRAGGREGAAPSVTASDDAG